MRNTNKLVLIAFFPILIHFLLSCSGDGTERAPDVSHINVNVQVQRFDQDLFSLDTNNMEAGLRQLATKYPDFLPFFMLEIVHDPYNPEEEPLEAITGFVTAPQVRRLNDSCQVAFPNLDKLTAELEQLTRYYKYYFPNRPSPRYVITVTEFIGDVVLVNDSLVMISLDMFLGENFTGYNHEIFPQYIRRQFSPEFISTKVALQLANRIVGPASGEQILDYMICNGKKLYLMDLLLPGVPDSIKMGYTRDQMEGCYANEQEVWAKLLEKGFLYQPVNSKNQKIVTLSPSTDNLFQEAPGAIGNWIGWRMVESYKRRYPDATFEEMLNLRDAQQFLEKAKYKPKRVQ